MLRIIQKRNWLFAFSLLVLVPGTISLFMYGLKLGLDFTGGTRMTLQYASERPLPADVTAAINELSIGTATAQTAGERDIIVRLPAISNDQRQQILTRLTRDGAQVTETAFESIGPTVGRELWRRAIIAMTLVLLSIVVYISWAFRKVGVGPVPSWVYGLSAIISLLHDALLVVGIFSLLGKYFDIEVDSLFVTAMLTVVGFSVHDTIVVFDRVRERLLKGREATFEETVNVSLNQTLIRSIGTSVTTLLVLMALYLFGGATIQHFVLALLIGIASGTYSSIFVASALLVVYERWKVSRRRA